MKICWFGIYNPNFSRNKVYMSGLRQFGVKIMECRDSTDKIIKFWRLWKKHRSLIESGGYDYLIVGYPGHIVVPFAKFISKKPVIFDALCTLYEGEIISRGKYRFNPFMRAWILLVDWLAVKCADLILVESDAQKEFFLKRFRLNLDRVVRVFTGVDEEVFHPDPNIPKLEKFTAVFRGRFLPEAGIKYVVQATKILEKSNINVRIIGEGYLENKIAALIDSLKPTNLEWIHNHLPANQIRVLMSECHVSLGQFENHDRLNRTIPHKAFESLAISLPYISARSRGVSELLTDSKDCLMVNHADPDDLAAKILLLKDNSELRRNIAENGRRLYEEKLTPARQARKILDSLSFFSHTP